MLPGVPFLVFLFQMLYITTPRMIIYKGLREKACEVLRIDVGAVNEGKMSLDENITLTESEGIEIGLIKVLDNALLPESQND